jgi:hypothetical protein
MKQPEKIYKLNDIVFHVTDPEQNRGIITGILERPTGYMYLVTFGIACPEQYCYATELVCDRGYF